MVHRAYTAAGYSGAKEVPEAPLTPDLDPVQVYCRIESTVETLVLLLLDPVIKGIPSLGILPVRVEARRCVGEHGSPQAALSALIAKAEAEDDESGMSQRFIRKVSELLVMRFLPVVGAGAFLSYTIFSRLRLAALVAETFGHDVEDPDVQGLLFFCILPGDAADESAPDEPEQSPGGTSAGAVGPAGPAARAAHGLGRGLARQVLQRSTGWRSAADLYDLAAAICSERIVEEARGPQACTVRRAQMLFKPSSVWGHPALLAVLAVGALAPLLVTLATLLQRWSAEVAAWGGSLGLLVQCLFWALVALPPAVGVVMRWRLVDLAAERPELCSSAVLLLHAALPLFAAFSATRLVVAALFRRSMAHVEGDDAGILFLVLGGWNWLRLWQRMQAPNGPERPTAEQQKLLGLLLALGCWDLLGDGLGFHAWNFGVLRSAHWFVGLLQAQALECQLRLLTLLKHREVLLRVLGATHLMGLAVVLFLGGVTASVGFLVSRREFTRFVDGLAPPPRVTAAIVLLRREQGVCALALGAAAGLLWQLPPGLAVVAKAGGVLLGATAVGLFFGTFEEFRGPLLEPSGGRWLLVLPETSEKAKLQALRVWTKLKLGAAEVAVERGALYIGRGVLDSLLNYLGTLWVSGNAVEVVEKVVEAE
ncbi:unnamed protein product [Effrenium voratum]|uniref:Uncharacterized protein n=1 Tax=Effrenium voratum TaxID=2562239 RepID=A0AA36N971_9DINO|nr:unnamed protein product [Effrenium voratum]